MSKLTGMGLSTVGYLHGLWERLFVKRGARLTSENSCYKKLFLQTTASVFVQCAAKEAKDDIDMIWVVVSYLVYMFKELISASKKLTTFKVKNTFLDKNLEAR